MGFNMYQYSLMQWLFFFYIYCFFGWCFESAYVSIVDRKLTNRGFMKGPWLPIYGSGAIVILWAALPVKGNPALVYLVGALAATVLEYFTGVCMEALFEVRYWDYSSRKWNVNGHICLTSTLTWGVLSLTMIYGFHRPVERLVLSVPLELLSALTLGLTAVIAADFISSFRTAMDIRDLLVKAEEMKKELKLLQKRVDVYEAFFKEDRKQHKEQRELRLEELEKDIKERLDRLNYTELSQAAAEKINRIKEEVSALRYRHALHRENYRSRLSRDKEKMLKRNPSAKSVRYKELLEDIKNSLEEKRQQDRDLSDKEDTTKNK